MPRVAEPAEIHPGFRFTVNIDGVAYAAFTECTLPSLQVETEEVKEGGRHEYVHKLPLRVKAGSVTLRRGITKNDDLWKWYKDVLSGNIADALREVTIIMYDGKLKPISTWVFSNAYPVKWGGPTLKSGDQALAIEELEIAHHGFTME